MSNKHSFLELDVTMHFVYQLLKSKIKLSLT